MAEGEIGARPGGRTVNRVPQLRTARLLLRGWREADRGAFAAMNADPEVVHFLPAALSRAESDAFVDRIEACWAKGYGLWAVEVPGVAPFVGYTGLSDATFEAPFTPVVEVGWRLARPAWGHGYATEAARAALAYGFATMALPDIVTFTAAVNLRSRAVMERLGMVRDPAEDFDHPRVAEGHFLRRHVLYRVTADARMAYG